MLWNKLVWRWRFQRILNFRPRRWWTGSANLFWSRRKLFRQRVMRWSAAICGRLARWWTNHNSALSGGLAIKFQRRLNWRGWRGNLAWWRRHRLERDSVGAFGRWFCERMRNSSARDGEKNISRDLVEGMWRAANFLLVRRDRGCLDCEVRVRKNFIGLLA